MKMVRIGLNYIYQKFMKYYLELQIKGDSEPKKSTVVDTQWNISDSENMLESPTRQLNGTPGLSKEDANCVSIDKSIRKLPSFK